MNSIWDVRKFIVDRSKWSYGKGSSAKILNDDGTKDCIGFLLTASGCDESQLVNKEEPIDIAQRIDWRTKLIIKSGQGFYQTQHCNKIITVNDDVSLSLAVREGRLKQLFAGIGIEVSFQD